MERLLISRQLVPKMSGILFFFVHFSEKRLNSPMAALMIEVNSIFKTDFSNICPFIAANTNKIHVAIETTELPIMMTSWASYRKRFFERILSSNGTFGPEQYRKMPDRKGNPP